MIVRNPWPPIMNRHRLPAVQRLHHDYPAAGPDLFDWIPVERDRARFRFRNLFTDSAGAAPADRSGPVERAGWWPQDSHAAFAPVLNSKLEILKITNNF